MKIVSRNYRDRDSDDLWLLRDADTSPDAAQPVSSIVATSVAFCASSRIEVGFGCRVIALCGTVEPGHPPSEEGVQLHFNGAFFEDPDGRRVIKCDKLILNADGSMYATLPAIVARPR